MGNVFGRGEMSCVARKSVLICLILPLCLMLVGPPPALADESQYNGWADDESTVSYLDLANIEEKQGIIFEGTVSGALSGTTRWGMNTLKFDNSMAFYHGWGLAWGLVQFNVNGATLEGDYIQLTREVFPYVYYYGYFQGPVEGIFEGVFDYTTYTSSATGELTRTDTDGSSPRQVSGTFTASTWPAQDGKVTTFASKQVLAYDPHASLPNGTITGFFNSVNNHTIGQVVLIYDMTLPSYLGSYAVFGDYDFDEAVLGHLTGKIYGAKVTSPLGPVPHAPETGSFVNIGNQRQEDGNIGIVLGDWYEGTPGSGHHNNFLGTEYHAKTAADFFLLSPLGGANLRTMPTFSWSAGGNNLFSVEFSYDPLFATVLWTTYDGGIGGITEPYWTMPESLWSKLPNQQPVYWRVKGTDTGLYPYVIETTEIRSFTKGGIRLAAIHEPDKRMGNYPAGTTALHPQLANDSSGHVYAVWGDNRNEAGSEIYFNHSSDHGATWQPDDIRLDSGDMPGSSWPDITCDDSGMVYVVWSAGNLDIYFNRSADHGVTWLPSDIRIDSAPEISDTVYAPKIAADDLGHVYVTWQDTRDGDYNIYFNCSLDYGLTWLPSDIRLDTDVPVAGHSQDPKICCDRTGNVYVVWADNRNSPVNNYYDIYLNRSSDYGLTWQASDIRLDTDIPLAGHSEQPQISCDESSHVYVTWGDYRNGGGYPADLKGDIYFNFSRDSGGTWLLTDKRLNTDSPGAAESYCPQIASDRNGHVYATWWDRRDGDSRIYFNSSSDYGANWRLGDVRIDSDTPALTPKEFPKISSDENGNVYVTWQANLYKVYLSHSSDYGATWQSNDVRLDSNPSGWSWLPVIASDENGHVYAAWRDERSGTEEVYFARAIIGTEVRLKSAPIFNWSASSCLEVYSVDFSTDPAFGSTLWRSYEDGGISITEPYWAMPLSIWNQVPANQTLYWRVRGAESDDLSHILASDEAWPFVKPAP